MGNPSSVLYSISALKGEIGEGLEFREGFRRGNHPSLISKPSLISPSKSCVPKPRHRRKPKIRGILQVQPM